MKKNKCGSTSSTRKPSPRPQYSGKSDKGSKSAKDLKDNNPVFSMQQLEPQNEAEESKTTIFV